jgi:hypothetical protein
MSDIFISYAREDRDKAKALAELCQQQDWSVWWDRRIPPGRSFDEVIEEALGAAKCVVVLWSKSSASSDWVKGEAAEGWRRKILVPVRIDSATVPLEFRRLQTVDLSDWEGDAGHLELGGFLEAVAANIKDVVQRPPSEGSQRKLMKPVLTVLAIVALLAAGFAFYKFAGDRARLGSRASRELRVRRLKDAQMDFIDHYTCVEDKPETWDSASYDSEVEKITQQFADAEAAESKAVPALKEFIKNSAKIFKHDAALIWIQHCVSPAFAANDKKLLQQNWELLLQQTSN